MWTVDNMFYHIYVHISLFTYTLEAFTIYVRKCCPFASITTTRPVKYPSTISAPELTIFSKALNK